MIMARRGMLGLLAGLPWAGLARAASLSFPRDTAAAGRLRRRLGVPALAAGWREGATGGETCAGLRMIGATAPVAQGDAWHWGSVTKPVTATLIALAVEAGELAWDEPLLARLAWHDAPAWQGVTLLHLLSHTSGFPRLDSDGEMDAFPAEEADPRASRLALTRMTLARAPEAAPGTRFIYSNRNYVAAAAMLEAACGQPWETLVAQRLFAPLGMAGAGFGAPGTPGLLDQPVGHAWWPGEAGVPHPPGVPPTDNPAVAGPAARLHAPIAAMIAFLEAHRTRAPLLRPQTWQRLHTPPFGGSYALGWVVRPDGTLWHDGSNNLWTAQVLVRPDAARAIATNWGDHQRLATPLEAALHS
ncbi:MULTISPECIES: serine hydrolase domain-containing protein [unclassified Sphingomonas]|uniref:serine hydrolase domain-containing protein n=1 Tax=Novosphingobium rhizosphaerae TaxID=1551649 RepID=UPI0015C7238B